jgi:hypothetical protein
MFESMVVGGRYSYWARGGPQKRGAVADARAAGDRERDAAARRFLILCRTGVQRYSAPHDG